MVYEKKTANCTDCGNEFTYEKKRGPKRKFCDQCNEKKKQERTDLFLQKMREKKEKKGLFW